ncbi:GNAT family N-acetyltransferase [Marinicella sp. W31]|uniref:GNAT family N-acetyltransferase n=1 Tax=Marinicella sp. W31 TaxID=3023713 RepID=UPI003756E4E7
MHNADNNNWLACTGQSGLLSDTLQFRTITDQDMDFLAKLYASTRWEELQKAPWDDAQRFAFLNEQFNAQHTHYQSHYPHAEYLIIQQLKEPIGRIYLDRDDTSICLIDIALLPEHKGQGIGTQLLKELLTEAQRDNKKVTIHVENFNPAYHWYVKHGFQQKEDRGVYQYMEWYPSN